MIRHHEQNTQTEDPINLLLEHRLAEGLPQIAEMLMNPAMLIERSAHLRADLYEHKWFHHLRFARSEVGTQGYNTGQRTVASH
jgi:hypothetical protein